jgi:hypothetical protein
LENEGRNNTKCGDQHSVPRAEAKEISCSPPLTGRYQVEVFAAGLQAEKGIKGNEQWI